MPVTKGAEERALRSHKTTWITCLMSWTFRIHPSMLWSPRSTATCFCYHSLSVNLFFQVPFPAPAGCRHQLLHVRSSPTSVATCKVIQLCTLTRFHFHSAWLSKRRYPTCIQRPSPPKIQPCSDLLGLFWSGIHNLMQHLGLFLRARCNSCRPRLLPWHCPEYKQMYFPEPTPRPKL